MPKLNDTQTILLSHASQRADHTLYPLPDPQANGGARVSKAIAGLLGSGLAEERQTTLPDQIARSDGDLGYGLFVTTSGLTAIGIEAEDEVPSSDEPESEPVSTAPVARTSKTAAVLALLGRAEGATLPELIAATGWLPHTTRAALTGLRKKGHAIERAKRDGVTCYHLAGTR